MPIENFIVYQKAFDFFVWQKSVAKHLAKVHKYSLGVQIENESLRLLRNIVIAVTPRLDRNSPGTFFIPQFCVYAICYTYSNGT